ncbi:EPIDERMAL PATTERNING FACTOR-like protein 2 isoform X2 [Neltuma alba]|uniref:EPIDERMAL PATTERNING FACTOR-like protein 2 isoform X2 n=1 Tax=Neltuma alba TaxID=207710 RepID=UPI0010A3AE73|nr:EPIDERMAL PATTERNING FACTOR-like protein 2 isoform X2 [Prosopis alba]
MGSSQVCYCWLKYRHLILCLLILFAPTSIFTHDAFMAEGRQISGLITANKGMKVQGAAISKNAEIGSRPPKCERRCRICGHCEAVQVPVVPQVQSHRSDSAVTATPIIAFSRTDDLSNYKPMSWKCKCGDYFFNP